MKTSVGSRLLARNLGGHARPQCQAR